MCIENKKIPKSINFNVENRSLYGLTIVGVNFKIRYRKEKENWKSFLVVLNQQNFNLLSFEIKNDVFFNKVSYSLWPWKEKKSYLYWDINLGNFYSRFLEWEYTKKSPLDNQDSSDDVLLYDVWFSFENFENYPRWLKNLRKHLFKFHRAEWSDERYNFNIPYPFIDVGSVFLKNFYITKENTNWNLYNHGMYKIVELANDDQHTDNPKNESKNGDGKWQRRY